MFLNMSCVLCLPPPLFVYPTAHHYHYRVCLMTRVDSLRLKHSLNTSLDYVEDDDDAFEPHSPYRYKPLSSVVLLVCCTGIHNSNMLSYSSTAQYPPLSSVML